MYRSANVHGMAWSLKDFAVLSDLTHWKTSWENMPEHCTLRCQFCMMTIKHWYNKTFQ